MTSTYDFLACDPLSVMQQVVKPKHGYAFTQYQSDKKCALKHQDRGFES
jgi:hypothetical protein